MATTTTWTGASSSDWDTSGNWTNGVPASTSTVVIDGTEDITGGEPTAEQCDKLYIAETYTGALGSSGTPLELDVAQVSFDSNSNSDTCYLHLLGTVNTTPDVIVNGSNAGAALVLSGTIDRLLVADGFVGTLTAGNGAAFTADISNFYMLAGGGTVDMSNAANLSFQSSSVVYITGGNVTIGENFGATADVTVSGGTLTVSSWDEVAGDTITMLGGTVAWNAGANLFTTSSVNGVHNLYMYGGTFTMDANPYAYVSFDYIYQFDGTVDLESSFANVEVVTTYQRFGGTFIPPKQSTITTSAL